MGGWLFDLKCAIRGLRAKPGFAVTAVLTVELGVGATTAIFSLFHVDRGGPPAAHSALGSPQ